MRILSIIGVVLLLLAVAVSPVSPLFTTIRVPASIDVLAGNQTATLSQHAGWKIAFKSVGMVGQGVNFYIQSGGTGLVLVTGYKVMPPKQFVYTFDVISSDGKVHVDLPNIEFLSQEEWSFEFITVSEPVDVFTAAQTPPTANDLYFSMTMLGTTMMAFTLTGARDWIVPHPIAQFSYQTNDLTLTVHDESLHATTAIWAWGDGTFTNKTTETDPTNLTHTYATAGTYTVVLNVQNEYNDHDSIQYDITMAIKENTSGRVNRIDVRWFAFGGLLVAGLVVLVIGRRLKR